METWASSSSNSLILSTGAMDAGLGEPLVGGVGIGVVGVEVLGVHR